MGGALQLTPLSTLGNGAGITQSSNTLTFPIGTYYVEIGLQMESDTDLGPGNISNPVLQFYLTDNQGNPQGFMGPMKTLTTGSSRGSAGGFYTGLTAGCIVNFTSSQACQVRGFTIGGWNGGLLGGNSFSCLFITKL